jgi:Rod binding domain-containing protein
MRSESLGGIGSLAADRAMLAARDATLRAGFDPQAATSGAEQQDVSGVASQFAAVFVQQLLREMFETVKEGEGPFGSGPGSDVQRGIAEGAIAKSLADDGFASLRDAIAEAIVRSASDRATTGTNEPSADVAKAAAVRTMIESEEPSR